MSYVLTTIIDLTWLHLKLSHSGFLSFLFYLFSERLNLLRWYAYTTFFFLFQALMFDRLSFQEKSSNFSFLSCCILNAFISMYHIWVICWYIECNICTHANRVFVISCICDIISLLRLIIHLQVRCICDVWV